MDFELQRDFAAWIGREAKSLPGLVEDLTEMATASRSVPPVPDERSVLTLSEKDIIGDIMISQTDMTGQLTTRFFRKDGQFLGLTGENLIKILKFSERISSHKELRDILSSKTIREIVLGWISDIVCNEVKDTIVDRIQKAIRASVRSLTIWIPIEDIRVSREMQFGDATLRMVSRRELDKLIEQGMTNAPADAVEQLRRKLHRQWLGKASMRFSLQAEPERAQELAIEKAEDYMALLQFYGLAPLLLPVISYAAPSGSRPHRLRRSIAVEQEKLVHVAEAIVGGMSSIQFDDEYRVVTERGGLLVLSSLAIGAACEYEEALLKTLLVYGRACYQLDPMDKLLQIMTAVEMFTLRDDNEPITATVGDRIAYAIAKDASSRQSVVRNFRLVYALRSKRVHHGHTIEETQAINTFLYNVWEFLNIAIQGVGRFKTRRLFLDHIDHIKYS